MDLIPVAQATRHGIVVANVPGVNSNTVAESDFIVLSCPLTDETRGLVSRELLARVKPGACIVNVSRGAVIDDAALIEALRAGRLGGAALDVFVEQPLPANHPFYSLENVLLTPHLAGGSMDSTRAISIRAAEQALQILAGEKPRHFYNPEVWERARARRR